MFKRCPPHLALYNTLANVIKFLQAIESFGRANGNWYKSLAYKRFVTLPLTINDLN